MGLTVATLSGSESAVGKSLNEDNITPCLLCTLPQKAACGVEGGGEGRDYSYAAGIADSLLCHRTVYAEHRYAADEIAHVGNVSYA